VLSDSSLASEDETEEPRDPADTLEDCSPESLQAVGDVTLTALDLITTRLAKIDRFSEYPFEDSDEALEVPVGQRSPLQPESEAPSDSSEGAGSVPAETVTEAPEEPAVVDLPEAVLETPAGPVGASDL